MPAPRLDHRVAPLMNRRRWSSLWRHSDFLKLWAGQTVSIFGSLITVGALKWLAIIVLNATAVQMAVLGAADLVPGILAGLVAGVWVDRLRRRPLLIGADLGRALLLATIPAAAVLHLLRIEQLYVVAFLTGMLTVVFDVAYLSYLPSLLRREELVDGNSKLAATASVAEVGAFGISGWLVQWFTAPFAILVDAVSFVFSAGSLLLVQAREPTPAPSAEGPNMRLEIDEGLRILLGNPLLRAIAGCTVSIGLTRGILGTVVLLYLTREVGFKPGILGLIFAVGGVSSFFGAVFAGWASRRLGIGSALTLGLFLSGVGTLFIPLAHNVSLVAVLLLVANQLVTDPAHTVYDITEVSLRQAITPERLLGRVNASIRFVGLAAMLAGTLLGGVLGQTIGLRFTEVIGALVTITATLWIVTSPARQLRGTPERIGENGELALGLGRLEG